jgi:hypothetical protein
MFTIAILTTEAGKQETRKGRAQVSSTLSSRQLFAYWPMVTVPPRVIRNIGWVIVSRSL